MKKLMILVLSIMFLLVGTGVKAEDTTKLKDIDLTVKGVYTVYQDKDLLEDGKGAKVELRYKWAYAWGSWERTELRLTGQQAGNIDLFGVGLGTKIQVFKSLSFFVEGGYYIPKSWLSKNEQQAREGIYYKWYKTCDDIGHPEYADMYQRYEYELKSGFGGSLGLDFTHKIYKNLYLSAFGSYRFLNLKEDWDAYSTTSYDIPFSGGGTAHIQTKEKRSFSGAQFGVGITCRF